MNIQQASRFLQVQGKVVGEFEREDIFNDNIIKGFICRQSDYRYGAMIICKINDEECEQVIWGTPKLHYPFDKNGKYNWPAINQLEIYEKLDGTNILAYHYKYKDKDFVSFKTRLGPVVSDMAFGNFRSMWIEYYEDNDWIKDIIKLNPDYNLSFELFGERNLITVFYDFPLEVNLLFGIHQNRHSIRPPSQLKLTTETKIAPKSTIKTFDDLTKLYNDFRKDSSELIKKNDLVTEGNVFYVHSGKWHMYKCKPEEIEKIHWAAGGGIPKISLWNTIINAFEDIDNPTMDDIEELLLEEYTKEQIIKSRKKFEKFYKKALKDMEFKKKVNEAWAKARAAGFDIREDKRKTMRFLSEFFDKHEMRKVGSTILKQAKLI